MAEFHIQKLVFLTVVLVLLRFNQDLQIQCTQAEVVTLENPEMEKEVSPLPEIPTDAVQMSQNDPRKKRNDDDVLLDIEEKDMYLAEKLDTFGKSVSKLKNFVPEDDEKTPNDIKELQNVMKIDPAKEEAHEHGLSTVETEDQSNDEENDGNDGNDDDDDDESTEETPQENHSKPALEVTNDDSLSEETVHQLHETEGKILENEETGQSEIIAELDPDSDLPFETPRNEDEEDDQVTLPMVYGAGTLMRPVQTDEGDEGNWNVGDNGDGHKKEDHSHLKKNVLTRVLDVELITDGYDCEGARGPLAHVAHESKFFVDRARLYNFREAREVCSKYNLIIAEIEEVADHRTIEQFVTNGNYYVKHGSGGRFFIGLNDIKNEGVYQYANGKNVTFQNFLPSQPDDKHESEDCATIMKEHQDGAAGAADYDCNKTAHVFCMHQMDSQCYNDSKETKENRKHATQHDLHLLVNATERAYFVSNYQSTWKEAMKQCDAKQMKLFSMDAIVNMGFFRAILRWEKHFFRVPMPTVQYWTSGKFKKSHMTAPIIWHVKPDLNESEERGVEKHNGSFSFSGLFHWSSQKKRDPGGPHGWRKDLCVSFGFDSNPEAIPFVRNTNCDLPTYFICYAEYPDTGEESGEETTTEEGMSTTTTTDEPTTTSELTTTDASTTTNEPIIHTTTDNPIIHTTSAIIPVRPCPRDFLLPPEPENETKTAEIEAMFIKEGISSNVSCTTNDKDDDVELRSGIIGDKFRWHSGFNVYIDEKYDANARTMINNAMDRLSKVVCVPFKVFRPGQRPCGDYVHIRDKGECYSHVGKQGGAQEMSLGRGCLHIGIIMHELIHALGFWHEHSRPDRDKYVEIIWKNIIPKHKYNFEIKKNVLTFGIPYNTISIMHYRSWEFSSNGRYTIIDWKGGHTGSLELQKTDVEKLKKMYKCGGGKPQPRSIHNKDRRRHQHGN